MHSASEGAHTVTFTPRATSPAASERTCALLPALPPPSTCTVRSGDWPCGEWLLTGVTWPGLLVRRGTVTKDVGTVTKNVQKDGADGVRRAVSRAPLRQGCQAARVFRERRPPRPDDRRDNDTEPPHSYE
ncbi:hypothetical protein GCM10010095_76010 [Streptomyces anthocyanicus]|uniref:Uncharacterized protein n=1 Tax=Streptomyces violaceolatus TaxID=67378 RepID=A0ABN3SJE3_9ACTN|nr:hypothetical protein GCM10010095_76010 [Streptomyces anthocyanicus]GHC12059.1 hypothetical protein GCM10010348_38930 [Streptomyces anthocyanicus]